MKNFDSYYDPPDEPEAVLCDECGKEMEEIDNFGGQRDMKCVNSFCPSKFDGIAKEMAYSLLDSIESLYHAKYKIKRLERELKDAYGDNTSLYPKGE